MQFLLVLVCAVFVQLSRGIYFQPDVLFFSEQPTSQHLVANSDLNLSCGLQLQSLRYEEGALPLPIIRWSVNRTLNVSEAFPEATNLQIVHSSQYLTSTLHIPHTSHPHTGTYHCYVVDGTAENVEVWSRPPFACKVRHMCRGSGPPCQAFITASNPATVTVIENSTSIQAVQLDKCSSLILQCGSLLVGQGLRPILKWDRDGTPLNSSLNIQILSTGDMSLLHSNNVGVAGTYRCVAVSGSHSVTVATYAVKGGASPGPSSIFLQLVSSPPSPITEGSSVDLTLSSTGECLDQLKCVWMRSNISLCLTDSGSGFENGGTNASDESDSKYGCTERGLRMRSLSSAEDDGEYCCVVDGVGSVGVAVEMGTLCLNIEVWERAPPDLSSPYNGTTITVDLDRPANLTFNCTSNPAAPPTINTPLHRYWLYNGDDLTTLHSSEVEAEESGSGVSGRSFVVSDDGRQLEVWGVNGTDVVGVYQCFIGNGFGYSVVTLRVIPNGVANPPGISVVRDAPWPTESSVYFTYNISWLAPSYPHPPTNITYLLDVSLNEPQKTNDTFFLLTLQEFAYYNIILTAIIAADSGEVLSEPSCFFDELQSECKDYVLFPPRLNTACSNGIAQVEWTNSERNDNPPGLYYINTTCHFLSGSVYVTNRVFWVEATMQIETEFPLGTQCQFKGAAIPNTCLDTPDACPFRCVDPVAIKYNVSSCEVEAYVELENTTNEVMEGSDLEVCLLAQGYNYSLVLVVDYSNHGAVTKELFISSPGERVCTVVEVEDNSAVEKERTATVTLSSTSPQVRTGPSSTITIWDDDVVSVFFDRSVYEVDEGWPVTVCVEADRDIELRRPVAFSLTTTNITAFGGMDYKPMYASHQFVLDMNQTSYCVAFNTSDDGSVDSNKHFQVILTSTDDAVSISSPSATVAILDDDVVYVGFSQTSYTTTVGEESHMCILASGGLERTLAVDISVNREDLKEGHIVELTHQMVVFSSARSNVCVLFNASGITHTVMVVLVLRGSDNEQSIMWTNQSATVTILPITTAPSSGPGIVIILAATLTFVVLCVTGGCCLVVEIFRRKRRDNKVFLQPEPLNKNKEMPLGPLYPVPLDGDTVTLFESLEFGVLSSDLTAEDQDKKHQMSVEAGPHKQIFHQLPLSTSKNTSSSSGCSDMSSSTHHDYIDEDELRNDHSAIHRQSFVSHRTAALAEPLVREEKDKMDLLSDIVPQLSVQDSGLGMEMEGSGGGGVGGEGVGVCKQ